MVKKSIEIRDDQEEWLDDNDWFNLSGAVRQMLDNQMEQTDQTT